MAKTKPNDIEGVNHYIANLPVEQQNALERVRQIIKNTVPEAVEFISYKMPAYHFHGMIGGFAAFRLVALLPLKTTVVSFLGMPKP
ncbi:MAG: hypothetical protein RIT22_1429 [Bacteroidota bacterium]